MSEDSKELELDIKKIPKFNFKNKKLKILLLLLIPLFLTIFFRAYPYSLPITDDLAEQNIDNSLRNQFQSEIINSFPGLSQEQVQELSNQRLQEFKEENKAALEQQKVSISNQIKNYYKNEEGQTYLIAIDPYIFLLQAKNVLFNKEKQFVINDYYNSPYHSMPSVLHPYAMIYSYKILNPIFKLNIHDISFAMPMIIAALSIIPAFFITRRISGNVGGLFGASMLALATPFLGRTPAGFSDTDAYNILFPLLIVWLFMESFVAKSNKNRYILAILAGLSTGLFSFAWSGWWYIFDFILGTIGIYFIYLVIKNRKNLKEKIKDKKIKIFIKNSIAFIISSGIFVSIMHSFKTFYTSVLNPIEFTSIQNAAKENYWPNVYTTVAELNRASIDTVISSIGGSLYFFLAILGIGLTFWYWRKKTIGVLYSILLTVWFIGTIYAATQGVRFIMNFTPAFSIAFGAIIGLFYYKVSKTLSNSFSINKKLIKSTFLILALLLMISPITAAHNTAKGEVPQMSDDWYNILTNIKGNSPKESIIASWWDFGWWFMSVGERQVIFSGGSQNQPQAHWVGKALLTKDEKESIGIFRMLVCSKNEAYTTLNEKLNDPVKAKSILDEILKEDKEASNNILINHNIDNPNKILDLTHCNNPPPTILITSEDMVSKSGVWAHFGSWDFEKTYIYNNLRGVSRVNFINDLQNNLDKTEEEASNLYNEFSALRTEQQYNSWIAPFTGYSNIGRCGIQEDRTICSNGAIIENGTGYISTDQGLIPLETFLVKGQGNIGLDINQSSQIAVGYNPETQTSFIMSPEHANSVFMNLFFFQESPNNKFTLIDQATSGSIDIYVWQVNFDN